MPILPDNQSFNVQQELLLTISIVTFKPDLVQLRLTLKSVVAALARFDPSEIALRIVDNSPDDKISNLLKIELCRWNYELYTGHGNIGFGKAHNLAAHQLGKYHLVLNPDILMEPDALQLAISFMQTNPECGLISPNATWPDGEKQYLCKRFPSVFDLLLRGFAPPIILDQFRERLSRYEMRSETQSVIFRGAQIISGCFMFFRSSVFQATQGFNPKYFLYFEDFDLSLRSTKYAIIAYVPFIKVIHAGGHASRKGGWHIFQFIRSATIFYKTHGLRIF